jgi:hypothetical protein
MSEKKLSKEERLAAALRANLRKRKAGAPDSGGSQGQREPDIAPGSTD